MRPRGGIVAGKLPNWTSTATSGVFTLREAQVMKSAGTWPEVQFGDQQFGKVSLLLHMEGTGATFADSSPYGGAVSVFGSATQSTAQAKYGSKSLLLGSGDYLSAAGNQFVVGTGDFTAEAWVYATSGSGAFRHVFDTRTSDATGFSLGFDDSNRVFLFSNNAFRVQAGSVALNQWYHLAVCRASGVTRVFLNGTQVGSDWSNTVDYSQTTVLIGKYYASGLYPWLGHIDEVRWSNTARYTTTFTPPDAAFPEAVPGTDPFYSNVSLLLLLNGSNNSTTFTDSSSVGHTITAVGDAKISTTQSKFGGSSLYLDGNGDYLSVPSHTSLAMGTGDFTIEFWAYHTDQTTFYPGYLSSQGGWNAGAWGLRYDNNGYAQTWGLFKNPADPVMTTSSTYGFNAWRHIALVRDAGTYRIYVDGTQGASSTTQGTDSFDLAYGGSLRIGFGTWDGANGYAKDYIDCLRITKSVCRYPGGTSFTPSTTAFATG